VLVQLFVLQALQAARFPAIFALLGATGALVAACGRHASPDEPTHIPSNPVAFDPPASYPDIAWTSSVEEARVRAADEHRPMIVFVRAAWSRASVAMDTTVWQDARVLAEAGSFVAVRVDLTGGSEAEIPESLKDFDIKEVPTTLVISKEGKMLGRFGKGKASPAGVAAAMKDAK
jgi:thiol:disulfide interchange protein